MTINKMFRTLTFFFHFLPDNVLYDVLFLVDVVPYNVLFLVDVVPYDVLFLVDVVLVRLVDTTICEFGITRQYAEIISL